MGNSYEKLLAAYVEASKPENRLYLFQDGQWFKINQIGLEKTAHTLCEIDGVFLGCLDAPETLRVNWDEQPTQIGPRLLLRGDTGPWVQIIGSTADEAQLAPLQINNSNFACAGVFKIEGKELFLFADLEDMGVDKIH